MALIVCFDTSAPQISSRCAAISHCVSPFADREMTMSSAPVQRIGADQGECSPERGLLRRATGRAQHGESLLARVGGPLPDRRERLRAGDDRRDSDGEQPRQ
jgi:hypothetical protein